MKPLIPSCIGLLLCSLLLAGCANPYEQTFREIDPGLHSDRVIYDAEPIRAVRGSDFSPQG